MPYETIIYQAADGIARITINRADALNALNPVVLSELKSAVETAGADDSVGVIVLTGAGRAFCAGVDLKSLGGIASADVGDDLNTAARDLQTAIETVPKAVIAMINGYCLTGGLEIALACDLSIAAEEAKIGDTHVKWGLRCTWGMSQRLPGRVGELKAREMTYTADMISGKQAADIGLVNRAVPLPDLETAVQETARKILANSRDAVAAHKHLYYESQKERRAAGLQREYGTMPEIRDTLDRIGGFKK
jgi:enoyl-CoA hydratase